MAINLADMEIDRFALKIIINMMNEKVREAAMLVMDELMEHPISNDFRDPIQPGEGEQDYFDVIKDPQDLSTIRGRLEKNEYKTVQEWTKDVETIWTNAETYHNTDPHIVRCAAACRKLFEKYNRKVDVLSMRTWCREVYRLRTRVYNLMGTPPAKVKQYASSLSAAHTMKQNMPPLTERDIQNLVQASEMMISEEEQAGMLHIIDEMQPEIDSGAAELAIDVTKMSLPTTYALREYIKNALEKRGAKYPE